MNIPLLAIWGNHDVAKGFEFHTRFPLIDAAYFPLGFGVEEITIPNVPLVFHAVNVKKKRDKRQLVDDFPVANGEVFHTGLTGEYTTNNCLPATLEDLRAKNYTAWILGHVHEPRTMHDYPYIGWPEVGQMLDLWVEPASQVMAAKTAGTPGIIMNK